MRIPHLSLALLVCLLIGACGSSSPRRASADNAFLIAQLAELQRMAAPAGTDPATWTALKTSLATMLQQKLEGGSSRGVSAAPVTDAARSVLSFNSATAKLDWGYYSPGDYNQDSIVNVSDLHRWERTSLKRCRRDSPTASRRWWMATVTAC